MLTLQDKVEDISAETLRSLLSYDAESGKLTWLPREREMFNSERAQRWWNTKWAGTPALSCRRADGYLGGKIFLRPVLAHRVIWAIVHGVWPDQIDHINHNRVDNRLSNLRSVPKLVNARNLKLVSTNTSGRVGVQFCRHRQKWVARQYCDGKRSKRYFKTFEEACEARSRFEAENDYHPNHGKKLLAA